MLRMNPNFPILLLIATICYSFECTKDSNESEESDNLKELLLRQNGWGVISQGIDPPIFIRGMEISDFTKLFEPCDFNTTIKFISDEENPPIKMVEFYGKDSCDSSETPYIIAEIQLQLDNSPPGLLSTSTDTGETNFWSILRLDPDRLIIQASNGEKTFTDEFGAIY